MTILGLREGYRYPFEPIQEISLDLVTNQITNLPLALRSLPKLHRLNMCFNPLPNTREEIQQLFPHLRDVRVSSPDNVGVPIRLNERHELVGDLWPAKQV